MTDELGGKWSAFNLDNSAHVCKPKPKNGNGNGNGNGTTNMNTKLTNGHNEISLELVLAKLKKIGITLDMEVFRNV